MVSRTFICLGNLTRKIYRRFRVSNLILTSIFPGPKEQTCDQVQRCLRPIVNDLYDLWKNGVKIKTPSCEEGES